MESEYIYSMLDKYFNALLRTGYIQDNVVMEIMALLIIDEINSEFKEFITEDDSVLLHKMLGCLYGLNCFINKLFYKTTMPNQVVGTDLCEYNV